MLIKAAAAVVAVVVVVVVVVGVTQRGVLLLPAKIKHLLGKWDQQLGAQRQRREVTSLILCHKLT